MFGSVSTSNVTTSCIVPSFAFVDCMYSMLSTPFSCCSSGAATACSIVRASAPLYVAVTVICGGTMSGNWAIGSACMATRPPSTVMMAMTMATTGRRMKNLDIGSGPFGRWGEWLGIHDCPIGRASAFHDDARAGLKPLVNNPAAADAVADLHRLRAHFVVGADDTQLKRSLQLADRALRHQQRVGPHLRFGTDATVLSWPQG